MTIQELKERGAIYIPNINDGFNRYRYETLRMGAQEAGDFFRKLWKENGNENAFVDFYYFSLSKESKQKVDSVLSEAEREYLHLWEKREYLQTRQTEKEYRNNLREDSEKIIFALEDMLLDIIVKLNAREMLFSTFYFTKEKSTWWGNYNQEYIVFRDSISI